MMIENSSPKNAGERIKDYNRVVAERQKAISNKVRIKRRLMADQEKQEL
jgi:hypothetical protein